MSIGSRQDEPRTARRLAGEGWYGHVTYEYGRPIRVFWYDGAAASVEAVEAVEAVLAAEIGSGFRLVDDQCGNGRYYYRVEPVGSP